MYPRRWIIAGVGLVVVLVLLFGLPAMQQSAWTQGYLMGRLSAGSAGATGGTGGLDPTLPYLYGGGFRGPHFGGFGAVFVLLLVAFLAARFIHGCRYRMGWGGPEDRGEGPQGPWQRHGHGPWGRGGSGEGGPGPERPAEGGTPTSRTGLV